MLPRGIEYSLGEAYMLGGNKELAIKNYQRSVELDPDNKSGREMLKKLTASLETLTHPANR
jgi:tetratricopeptide (TPR) repeat protein